VSDSDKRASLLNCTITVVKSLTAPALDKCPFSQSKWTNGKWNNIICKSLSWTEMVLTQDWHLGLSPSFKNSLDYPSILDESEFITDLEVYTLKTDWLSSQPGKTNRRGRISTVDLLIKVACFVKEVIFNKKGVDLNWLVQGGQPYWGFPSSKTSLSQHSRKLCRLFGHFETKAQCS